MALDEALYLSASDGPGTATLRLYRFQPYAVSFGYRQRFGDVVAPSVCRSLGIDWVRRPTGGRALLHQHELTYCVTSPSRGPLGGLSVRGVYDVVSDSIRRALERLGVVLDPPASWERARTHPPAEATKPCLAVPARHEITWRGRKLVASAQRRNPRCILQHGAILRKVDSQLWSRIAPPATASPLHAIGLDDLVPGLADAALVEALREAFEETFDQPASRGELTLSERVLLPPLIEKYRSRAWTDRCEGAAPGAHAPKEDSPAASSATLDASRFPETGPIG